MNQLADPDIPGTSSATTVGLPPESERVATSRPEGQSGRAALLPPPISIESYTRGAGDTAQHTNEAASHGVSTALNARTVVGIAAPSACTAIGDYWSFAQIASGGMATVHVGYGSTDGKRKTVAIKLLKPAFVEDEEFVAMFTSEARLAARIQHPNVVQTLDFVRQQGDLALVMDYIPGEALSKLLVAGYRDGNPATPPMLRRILADVLRGLHAAHEARDADGKKAQIVHRDVSPQNILVGVDGVARVLDFGIAQAAGRVSFTRDNEVRGKLSYVAPEQLEDGPIDLRADIYSASVVLWEALTCKRLFQTDDEATTLSRVLNLRVPPPSFYNQNVSPELDAVVLKGLNRNRQLRYQTAWDMARAVAASGPCATRDEVADWVNAVAAQKLSERQRLVAAMHGAAIDQPNQYPTHRIDGSAHGVHATTTSTVALPSDAPTSTDIDSTQPPFDGGDLAGFHGEDPTSPENSFADLPMVSDAHLAPAHAVRLRRRMNHAALAAATLFGGALLGTTLVLQGANFLEPTTGQRHALAGLERGLGQRAARETVFSESKQNAPVSPGFGLSLESGLPPDAVPRPAEELAPLGVANNPTPEAAIVRETPTTAPVTVAPTRASATPPPKDAELASAPSEKQGASKPSRAVATRRTETVDTPAVPNAGTTVGAAAKLDANPRYKPQPIESTASLPSPPQVAQTERPASEFTKRPAPVAATQRDCNPPFTVDASGIRRYKLECL